MPRLSRLYDEAPNSLGSRAYSVCTCRLHPDAAHCYRLARVAAGHAVACASLGPGVAHDVVEGHVLLLGACGVLLSQDGNPIFYVNASQLSKVSERCFGGAAACRELSRKDWGRLF